MFHKTFNMQTTCSSALPGVRLRWSSYYNIMYGFFFFVFFFFACSCFFVVKCYYLYNRWVRKFFQFICPLVVLNLLFSIVISFEMRTISKFLVFFVLFYFIFECFKSYSEGNKKMKCADFKAKTQICDGLLVTNGDFVVMKNQGLRYVMIPKSKTVHISSSFFSALQSEKNPTLYSTFIIFHRKQIT